jgi:hypothetical protein
MENMLLTSALAFALAVNNVFDKKFEGVKVQTSYG